jgi:two-component system sensor histidine kinase/response regulator
MCPEVAAGTPAGDVDVRDTVVVIDDDYAIRLSCRQALTKTGYRVEAFEDGAKGIEAVAEIKPALVVVDLKMPGISGLEVISRVHEIDPNIVLVVITGYATIGTAVDAMKAGAYDFLPKPFKPDELRLIVKRGLEHHHLLLEFRRNEMEREFMKRRFVSFVSHQLKTPLVAVHQYLDTMRRMGDTPEMGRQRQTWLDRCLQRTREMQQIINDWLTLAGMEGSCLSRRKEPVDLADVLCGTLKTHQEAAAAAGVTLSLDLPGRPYPVLADRTCMSVLFDNLIDNGIKYNRPGGTVALTARREGDEILVEVSDTGIGIPEKHRPFIFDEFYRVKDETCKSAPGSGLGLPICRRIVSEHGGSISFDSTVGTGSVFRVRFMVHSGDEEAAADSPAPDEVHHAQDTGR